MPYIGLPPFLLTMATEHMMENVIVSMPYIGLPPFLQNEGIDN